MAERELVDRLMDRDIAALKALATQHEPQIRLCLLRRFGHQNESEIDHAIQVAFFLHSANLYEYDKDPSLTDETFGGSVLKVANAELLESIGTLRRQRIIYFADLELLGMAASVTNDNPGEASDIYRKALSYLNDCDFSKLEQAIIQKWQSGTPTPDAMLAEECETSPVRVRVVRHRLKRKLQEGLRSILGDA